MSINHGKLTTTDTYYAGEITASEQEIMMSCFTTRQSMLSEVIDALSVITSGQSKKLDIEITIDSKGRYKLDKKWRIT